MPNDRPAAVVLWLVEKARSYIDHILPSTGRKLQGYQRVMMDLDLTAGSARLGLRDEAAEWLHPIQL